MRVLPHPLQQLEARLTDRDLESGAMSPTELDGFVAGLAVCPDAVASAEWLPLALGDRTVAGEPADGIALRDRADLMLAHRDAVDRTLGESHGCYRPVFDVDPRCGDILWELWADGFGRAMALRPDAWVALTPGLAHDPADGEAVRALAGLAALVAIATCAGLADPDSPTVAALTEAAPTLIPGWVGTLHGWRRRQAARVGRCGCGSERSYRTCCGLN